MAQVWEATDTVLGRRVAVKLLHPHLAGDPEFVERFRAEAKAAARLTHQSIVAIFDTASEDGAEAIIMELLEGITLRQYLDDYGALSLDDAADLISQVASALEAAHAARIVHRDIKPSNIMLCADRRVKVTDFGIAKALDEGDRTSQGTLLGTAKYLSPEQVEGKAVDARADIYSLGVVLYEALTGQPPFHADSDSATALARLLTDPRPPSEIRPSIPAAVEIVVLKAMARDRDQRYSSAAALREAMAAAVAEPAAPAGLDPTNTGSAASASDPSTPGRDEPDGDTGSPQHPEHRRSLLRPILVGTLVLGCLTLGVGLILATGAGQDFFDRLVGTSGDTGTSPEPEDPVPDIDSGAESAAPEQQQSNGSTEDPGTAEQKAVPNARVLVISGVVDFDPLGDGAERPDRTGFAIDGDPETAWTSEGYDNRQLGNLKDGVGLILILDSVSTLRGLDITSPTQDWAATIYVATSAASELAAWGDPLDQRVNISGNTTFDLRGVRGAAVLVWITDLGDAPPPSVRIEIAEAKLS